MPCWILQTCPLAGRRECLSTPHSSRRWINSEEAAADENKPFVGDASRGAISGAAGGFRWIGLAHDKDGKIVLRAPSKQSMKVCASLPCAYAGAGRTCRVTSHRTGTWVGTAHHSAYRTQCRCWREWRITAGNLALIMTKTPRRKFHQLELPALRELLDAPLAHVLAIEVPGAAI